MKHFTCPRLLALAWFSVATTACGVGSVYDIPHSPATSSVQNANAGTGVNSQGNTGNTGSTGDSSGNTGGNDTMVAAPTYQLQGRFSPGNANLLAPQAMSWGHSAVVARVTHTTQVTVSLTDVQGTGLYSLTAQNETDSNAAPISVSFDPSLNIGTLSGLDAQAVYTVTFLKHIEAMYSSVVFQGFSLAQNANYLAAPTGAARRMEVIGDSISAGYGDLGTTATCDATAANEESEKAYGPVAAATLGADLHLLAWSGKGVYLNNDHTTTATMPQIWQRADANDPTTSWDPRSWIPQVVVINLGTNDFTNPSVDQNSFVQAYTTFLGQLRSAYPQAAIIVSMGPMLQDAALATCIAYLQQAIAARQAAGDTAVSLLQYPVENTNTGAGCAYHPNTGTQASMASALVAHINTVAKW